MAARTMAAGERSGLCGSIVEIFPYPFELTCSDVVEIGSDDVVMLCEVGVIREVEYKTVAAVLVVVVPVVVAIA